MKTILGLMKHLYLKRAGIFLIAVALIVGTVGCEAGGAEVGPLDHFKWYLADSTESIDEVVYLEDQFCAVEATVGYAVGFGNPAEKVHGEVTTPISNPDHHLAGYEITYEEEPQEWFVEVENQFGVQQLTVYGPVGLAVPTQKEGHQPPVGLDHFLIYEVIDGPSVDVSVSLQDQFDGEPQESGVYEPMYFANPVKKTYGSEVTEVLNPEDHLVFYYIDADFEGEVEVVNQFGEQTLDVYSLFGFGGLAVPSEKKNYWQESVYDLTMAANPGGGGTATDLTDASPYAAGTDVSIQAVANPGYKFVSWTALAGAFADANTAETTFTMPAEDVTITANFETVPNHGLGYMVTGGSQYIGESVYLEDRFGAVNATVTYTYAFHDPVEKRHDGAVTPILNPDATYLSNNITLEGEPGQWLVVVENQFGIQELTVSGPTTLGTPAQMVEPFYHDPPVGDHLLSYHAIAGEPVNEVVDLYDEFGDYTEVLVTNPNGLSNPVRKIHNGDVTEILYSDADLCVVTYIVSLEYSPADQVQVVDQFGEQTLDLYGPVVLSVPSRILSFVPVFNHGLGYVVPGESQYIGESVYLEDRFGAVDATVTYTYGFFNPVEKWYEGEETPIINPDATYLSDNITLESEPGAWLVVIENQFGIQEMTVSGPNTLSTPAQELQPFYHDPPVGCDHLLNYHVIAGEAVNEVVDLYDEFDGYTEVLVTQPLAIGNPVRKVHDGDVTEILYLAPDFCVVAYMLSLEYAPAGQVQVIDQFGEQTLDVYGPFTLAVPSQILYYEQIS